MKELELVYRIDGSTSITANFAGHCGYDLTRDPDFASFWNEETTVIVPRHSVISIKCVEDQQAQPKASPAWRKPA